MSDEWAVIQTEYDDLLLKQDKTDQEWHRIEIIEARCMRVWGWAMMPASEIGQP